MSREKLANDHVNRRARCAIGAARSLNEPVSPVTKDFHDDIRTGAPEGTTILALRADTHG
jgi:hypothetical protein